ncbi:MAG: hypothetical protein JST00_34935 [Deltaproteobacteria bacterium]|nr:hypothetical protein [Deltaproteobacteria bacterium]
MSPRTTRRLVPCLFVVSTFVSTGTAHAAPTPAPTDAPATAPAFTLEVDSDSPAMVTYDLLAASLSKELGAPIVRPGAVEPSRAALEVRYRDAGRSLRVRAVHRGGRVLEREVVAAGDANAIRREATLLAGNLARDEAGELLDALAAARRPPPAEPGPTPSPEPAPAEEPALAEEPRPVEPDRTTEPSPEAERVRDDGRMPVVVGLFFPVATNASRPAVRSAFSFSLLYGRVGAVEGFDLSVGVAHASQRVKGAQIGGGVALAGDHVGGLQVAVGASIAGEGSTLAQASGGFNVAPGRARGAQIAAGANVATGSFAGAQIGSVNVGGEVRGMQLGLVNIASGRVRGAQVGLVNIADEVEGAPIGLVSLAKDSVHPVAWTSNLAYTNVGMKFTTRYVYTLAAIGFGTNEVGLDEGRHVLTLAIGGILPIAGAVDLQIEHAYSQQDVAGPGNANHAFHTRVLPGYSFAPHLRVFGGPGLRIPASFDQGGLAVRPEAVLGVQF